LAGAPPSTRFTLKIAFSTTPARESIVAVTKSTASRARSKLLILNSNISQLPSPRIRAMAGWSAGYQAARVRRQLTRGPISSLPGAAGLPPSIFFSTNYPDLDSAVGTAANLLSYLSVSFEPCGEGQLRTPGTGFSQYNGLANLTTLLTRSENFGFYYIPQAVTTRQSCCN